MTKQNFKPAKTLKIILDKVFSDFIRLRDSDNYGMCSCISCGKKEFWTLVDCGHYEDRAHMGTRYSEKNCNAQCRDCNRFNDGNREGYTRGLISKYGISVIGELETKRNALNKMSRIDYQIAIDHYREEVSKLKREKGL